MEAHHTKTAFVAFSKQLLDNQKKTNYQNEYEKARGILAQSNQQFQTAQSQKNMNSTPKRTRSNSINHGLKTDHLI